MSVALSFAFLVLVVLVLEGVCPYTKVEESFNMQAVHDMLFLGADIDAYDHHAFPGVVPRTFLGAAALAASVAPLAAVLPPLFLMLATRAVLGVAVCASIFFLGSSLPLSGQLQSRARTLLHVCCACTYHLVFYASRTVPNTYALILVNVAVGCYLRGVVGLCFGLLAAASAVFRSDVLVFTGPLAVLSVFVYKNISIPRGAVWGLGGAALALALTVPMDSYLWGFPLWPEVEVLRFNTVDNRSAEWGTSPFHWYFTSAIPKAFLLVTPFIFLAPFFTAKCRAVFIAAVSFIVMYSFLPHKEVRFVMIVFPTLLCPAVVVGAPMMRGWARWGVLIAFVCVQLCVIGFQGLAGQQNYPGAKALSIVHAAADAERLCGARIFIDAYAGMTGVNRFLKRRSTDGCQWIYNKDPTLFDRSVGYSRNETFDFLIVRHEDRQWHEGEGLFRWMADVETVSAVSYTRLTVGKVPFLSIFRRRVTGA